MSFYSHLHATIAMRSIFALTLLFLTSAAAAQTQQQRSALTATPVEAGAVRVDGVLDEAAWQRATPVGDFVQFRPEAGGVPTEATEARVLIGPKALYIGMRMADSEPSAINTRLARRDEGINSDHAAIVIDSYGDDRTGFFFRVSPGGVKMDILFYDDIASDRSWDAVWTVETTQDAEGWTAEFEIPLSQLRYAGGAGPHTWGLQIARIHFRTGELSYWTPRDPRVGGYVSQFGTLILPEALPAPRRFEAVPYVASALTRAPGDPADPFFVGNDLEPRAGADVKVGLTSGLTLAATINPDFGQVEADPAQVNLGGFELFFQERRPFFLEGLDAFSTAPRRVLNNRRPSLLYTRRIGRAPQRTAFVPDDVTAGAGDAGVIYTDAPQQSTILGAAKVSGQVGRFSVGLMNATTRAEYGRFRVVDGAGAEAGQGRALVEPLSNYAVARARGTFGPTILGALATSVVRDDSEAALADLLPRTATVVGADVERTLGSEWLVAAQVARSFVTGTASAITTVQTAFPRLYQRPDADHLTLDPTKASLSGWAAELNVLKTDGAHWTGAFHSGITSPGFDANDLGFQSRADFMHLDGFLRYNQPTRRGHIDTWRVDVFGGAGWNTDGDRIGGIVAAQTFVQFANFWSLGVASDFTFRALDDRLTRGGPLARADAGGDISFEIGTDSRKNVRAEWSVGAFDNELGRSGLGTSLEISARPRPELALSIEPSVQLRDDPRQYVQAFADPAASQTFGTRYVFGDLHATTLALETRLDWTFTPELTLQLYARPFVSRGRYDSFSAFDRPRAFRLPVYGEDIGTATETADGATTIDPGDGGEAFTLDRDFTLRSLQGNAVLRWEYRPGSALFLVWQHQREGDAADGALRFHRDVRGLFADAQRNVFVVKLTYWLG